MSHKVNVSISYEPPGKPLEFHQPGVEVDLSHWPSEDIAKMEAEGTISPVKSDVNIGDATPDESNIPWPGEIVKETDKTGRSQPASQEEKSVEAISAISDALTGLDGPEGGTQNPNTR